jgi:hypothetical protein
MERGRGQVTRGLTGIAGEAGPEAIVPLNRVTPEGDEALATAISRRLNLRMFQRGGISGTVRSGGMPPSASRSLAGGTAPDGGEGAVAAQLAAMRRENASAARAQEEAWNRVARALKEVGMDDRTIDEIGRSVAEGGDDRLANHPRTRGQVAKGQARNAALEYLTSPRGR